MRSPFPPVMLLGVGLAQAPHRRKSLLFSCSAKMPCLSWVPAAAFCSPVLLPGRSHCQCHWRASCHGARGRCPWTCMRCDSSVRPTLSLGAAGAVSVSSCCGAARAGGEGLAQPAVLLESFAQSRASCWVHPPLTAKVRLPSPPKPLLCQDALGSKTEPVHLPSTDGGSWMLLRYVLLCRRFPEEYFFPSLKTAALGPDCVNTAKYHLTAVDTRGLYLLGNDCVANILNNCLCNVCPGYCRIHFIIRALGCTLLIILSNNLHSTVSV